VVTENLTVEPGKALGVNQIGRAYVDSKEVITLVFRAAIGEPEPRDRIVIEGNPNIDMAISKGVNGDTATCAIIVNAIPVVIQAQPGLRTMADISPISFFS
jgi:4-hydroxy-tetrahydrodipicolinate reductase